MTDTLTIALAQLNPTLGDMAGNANLLRAARAAAARAGADLVVATELVVTGYPPEDLILRPSFLDEADRVVRALAAETADGGPACLIGAPWRQDGTTYNAALLLDGGEVASVRLKHDLPNYGPFDEKRVFAAGPLPGPINFRGVRLGAMVCEDMWTPDVAECLEESGAEILVVINGSPFDVTKLDVRLNLAVGRVTETGLPLVYVNQVGGQDELVFDGSSFVLGADSGLCVRARSWEPDLVVTRWRRGEDRWTCETRAPRAAPAEGLAAIYAAMVVGLRDYVDKNGFPGVIIGLSGGIDSAITAAVAADALGPDRVRCVMMPSLYTSRESLEDAEEVARLLGIRLDTIPIGPAMKAFELDAGAVLHRSRARHHRGEHPGARPRHHADGALQQVRLDGAVDRQQVRDVGRLLDAVWRYVRRLLGAEGRLQDDGVRMRPLAQRHPAGRRQGTGRSRHARARHQQAAVGRASPRPEGRGHAAALSGARRHPLAPQRARHGHRRDRRRRVRRGAGRPRLAHAGERRVQAPPGPARRQDHCPVVRPRPALSHHQRVQGLEMSGDAAMRVRFAPSPTGLLHVGNARVALVNFLAARKAGGTFVLRIDDTDRARSRPEFETAIRDDLAWLGLDWGETHRQSDRLARYEAAFDLLRAAGRAYPCYETEDELAAKRIALAKRGLPPIYDRQALHLTDAERAALEGAGRVPHWRFRLVDGRTAWNDLVRGPVAMESRHLSDPVVRRADGAFLYLFASAVDDLDLAIGLVVRGEDHVANTVPQLQIVEALGGDAGAIGFAHLSLLAGADGKPLSKRDGPDGLASLAALRAAGIEPMALASYLARLGTSHPIEDAPDLDALAAEFDFASFGRAPPRFDARDLASLSAKHLRALPYDRVADRLATLGIEADAPFWDAIRANLDRIEDARDWWQVARGLVRPAVEDAAVTEAAARLLPPAPWDEFTWPAWTKAVAAETGRKGRALYHPLRLALTGREQGPEMKALLPLIGRERAAARLAGREG